MDRHEAKAREMAQPMMLAIVNEWHRQVGIDDVMKTKLTRRIADTIATRVVEQAMSPALRSTRAEALTDAVSAVWAVKDRRGVVSGEMLDMVKEIAARIEALGKEG